jgi:monoamine oxidase
MDVDAVVIGAGAAGLSAARYLAARSLRVVLVEARDRIGGRVWSRPSGRAPVAMELGAEFIHGRAPQTKALLLATGSAAIDTAGESWTRHEDGSLRRDDDDFMSAASILEGARGLAADESVDRFLERFVHDATMRETARTARAFVEGFEAADPAVASARAIANELRSGVDYETARPLGGYPPMFEYLQNACASAGVRMFLSTAVRRISWGRGSVAVDVHGTSGESRTIRARAAIVTLPAGVLRHRGDTGVVFEPSLPEAKRAALAAIEMGHVVKVVLRFRTAFWETVDQGRYRDAGFFRVTGGPFAAYWTQVPVRSELIVAWVGGPKAVALSAASEDECIAQALDGFGGLFGEPALARREFEGGAMHDWSHDPFARGAYSYVATGGGDARVVLGAPVDDALFFAGEATSNDGQGGTVNGALETGERAAREAATALGVTHA